MSEIAELPATELGSMIVRTPGILGGKPHIRGHRVGVHRIAGWWKLGLSVEQISEELPTLNSAEIFAGLAFYHLNKAEIDGYLEEERSVARELQRQQSIS
ncbi:MAG TPA: DUF433 domain-containing protein [Verrucomicrobiae bacterium]|jgi:uncharacterized protein (DUF433 family)